MVLELPSIWPSDRESAHWSRCLSFFPEIYAAVGAEKPISLLRSLLAFLQSSGCQSGCLVLFFTRQCWDS